MLWWGCVPTASSVTDKHALTACYGTKCLAVLHDCLDLKFDMLSGAPFVFGAMLMLVAIGIASTIDGKSGQGLLHDHRQQNPHTDGDAVTPMSEFDEEAGQRYLRNGCIMLYISDVTVCVTSRQGVTASYMPCPHACPQ